MPFQSFIFVVALLLYFHLISLIHRLRIFLYFVNGSILREGYSIGNILDFIIIYVFSTGCPAVLLHCCRSIELLLNLIKLHAILLSQNLFFHLNIFFSFSIQWEANTEKNQPTRKCRKDNFKYSFRNVRLPWTELKQFYFENHILAEQISDTYWASSTDLILKAL